MSGGVDSSVAAALLKEEGHEVIGVTMQLWPRADEKNNGNGSGGCCGLDAIEDARKVADKLGIPHHVMDFRDIFARKVIADFCREYSLGRTPNPCVRCNQYIKFGALRERAGELGADFIATGHYARIERDKTSGNYLLKKGADPQKDQSYFLCQLTQEQLSHTLFPIGNLTKDRVREIARELGLPVAAKPESQEICFIPDDDYAGFLKDYIPQPPSPGRYSTSRETSWASTGASCPTPSASARDWASPPPSRICHRHRAGPKRRRRRHQRADLRRELIAGNLNWIATARPEHPINVKARVRYRHPEAEAIGNPPG